MSKSTVYVSKDGKHRVQVDESNRGDVNQNRAMGFRPERKPVPKPSTPDPKQPKQSSDGGES